MFNKHTKIYFFRYNDVVQEKEKLSVIVKSNMKQNTLPVSDNAAAKSLIAQNLDLREELSRLKSPEHVQEVVVCAIMNLIFMS